MGTRLYCVTCRTTEKMYVGITSLTSAQRWKAHCYNASRGTPTKFYNAIRKYGPADFTVETLFAYGSLEDAAAAEIECIDQLDLINSGYNSALGGYLGGAPRGQKRSPVACVNLKAGAAKRAANPSWRAKMHEVAVERAKNPDYIAKLSAAKTGKHHSEATKLLIKNKRQKQICTAATKAKMSVSRKFYLQRRREDEALSVYS